MGVRKFRSIEEMKTDRWRKPGAPELLRALNALWEIGARTRRHAPPRGVFKYRSVEEAKAILRVIQLRSNTQNSWSIGHSAD